MLNSKVTEVDLQDAAFVNSDIFPSTLCHIGPHFLVVNAPELVARDEDL